VGARSVEVASTWRGKEMDPRGYRCRCRVDLAMASHDGSACSHGPGSVARFRDADCGRSGEQSDVSV
jgi:hypothetical protein